MSKPKTPKEMSRKSATAIARSKAIEKRSGGKSVSA